MEQRIEHDTMGEVAVPADKLWGAQTQRSFENFPIGEEKMPPDLIHAFGVLKEACAAANHRLGTLDTRRYQLIQSACQAIRAGELAEQFPLSVWQTGSGTQTNMNCNEVIAHVGNARLGRRCSIPTTMSICLRAPTTPSPPLCISRRSPPCIPGWSPP